MAQCSPFSKKKLILNTNEPFISHFISILRFTTIFSPSHFYSSIFPHFFPLVLLFPGVNSILLMQFFAVSYNLNQMSELNNKWKRLYSIRADPLPQENNQQPYGKPPIHQSLPQKRHLDDIETIPNSRTVFVQAKQKESLLQISFEADFFEQHLSAFKKETKNFMESTLQHLNISFEDFHGLIKQYSRTRSKEELNKDEVGQLEKAVLKFRKLQRLLQLVQQNSIEEIFCELKYLTLVALKEFETFQKQFLEEQLLTQKFRKVAVEKADEIQKSGRIKFLNTKFIENQVSLSSQDEQLHQKTFLKFIQFYFVTVALVIQQYFQNPYFETNEKQKRKRAYSNQSCLSDSEYFSNFSNKEPTKKINYKPK